MLNFVYTKKKKIESFKNAAIDSKALSNEENPLHINFICEIPTMASDKMLTFRRNMLPVMCSKIT